MTDLDCNRRAAAARGARDDSGAIMIVGIFMAMFMVGLLYYVVGVGDALFLRERMQDAADAAALSAAIVHARGMNIIVMINVMMASLLAVVIMLKLLGVAIKAALLMLAGIAFFFPPAGAAVPPLKAADSMIAKSAKAVRKTIAPVLKAGNKLSKATAVAIPLAAQAKVFVLARNEYAPPVEGGVAFPIRKQLPVVDDDFDKLCAKGGEYAAAAIGLPLRKIAPDLVADKMEKLVKGSVKTFSAHFCGKGTGKIELPPQDRQVMLPEVDSDLMQKCQDDPESSACDEVERETARIRRSIDTDGTCVAGPDQSDCEARAATAAEVCNPDATEDLTRWFYQRQRLRQAFVLDRESGNVVAEEPTVIESVYEGRPPDDESLGGARLPPCGRGLFNSGWTEWGTGPEGYVCTEDLDIPTAQELRTLAGGRKEVTFGAVTRVHSCLREFEETLEVEVEPVKGSDSEVPKTVCGCVMQGDPIFLLKAFVLGDATDEMRQARRAVNLATWGDANVDQSDTLISLAEKVGRFGFAEAEYFYDPQDAKEDKRDEWMWHMRWRTRLRRFRMDGPPERECKRRLPRAQQCPDALFDLNCAESDDSSGRVSTSPRGRSRSGSSQNGLVCRALGALGNVDALVIH